ncbi:MAG: hypothetical protein ACXW08_10330 [Solirubrobacteraceae bacterium]
MAPPVDAVLVVFGVVEAAEVVGAALGALFELSLFELPQAATPRPSSTATASGARGRINGIEMASWSGW